MPTELHRDLGAQIKDLAPWFHNLHLPQGIETAPMHPLGDFPANKWRKIASFIPDDLTGWNVLDVGCNAGFYTFELARRGAEVTAIDVDAHYLKQAEWAAELFEIEDRVRFQQMQVYDLARTAEDFDLVWFMGVFYHLRYPTLGLDILSRKTKRLMVFQTMTAPGDEVYEPPEDFALEDREMMREPGWPAMYFVEKRLAEDPTNWWAANHACVEAVLRSAGLKVTARPAHEVYICEPHRTDELGVAELLETEYVAATGGTQPRKQEPDAG